jgi:hypothetical protein
VLETEIFHKPHRLRLILVHELFHFAWARLPNAARRDFSALLSHELEHGARGELGESSEVMKCSLTVRSGRNWTNYVCESFCDSAARFYAGVPRSSSWTLARRWTNTRKRWFEQVFATARRV